MAHFAKITENNEVLQVLTVNNSDVVNVNGVEEETVGQKYLEKHNNWPANMWIQTSYNTKNNVHKFNKAPFRGNYAVIGGTWDPVNNLFFDIKPYASWIKDTASASWKSPIGDAPELTAEQLSQYQAGTHGWRYIWNDNTLTWNLVDELSL